MALERHFFVKAKTFLFSVVEGKSVLRMEERRKGFLGVVLLGLQCTDWVVAVVKEALQSQGVEDFVKSSGKIQRLGLFGKAVIRMAASWSWRSMQWVAGEGSSCSWRVEEGRDGPKWLMSCAR
jgi:hypothetical protein